MFHVAKPACDVIKITVNWINDEFKIEGTAYNLSS